MDNYQCCICYRHFQVGTLPSDLLEFNEDGISEVYCSHKCKCQKKKKKIRHKFNAKPCQADDIKFSSKAERAYYNRLKFMQESGEVIFFLRQVPLHLPGNTKYLVDFQVFNADGTVSFIDVKGMRTPMFVMKKKQVEEIYPIQIEIVK